MISIEKFDFKYLWKLDDEEWMKKRKEEWKFLSKNNYSDVSAKSLNNYRDFYVLGEKKDYIGENTEFLFIPYDSAECAKKVFYSDFFSVNCREKIFLKFVFFASKTGSGMPWLSRHIKWFSDGVLGTDYEIIEEMSGKRKKIISPDPTYWCSQYVARAIDLIQGKIDYHGVIECVDYFVSAISFADRKDVEVNELIDCVNEALMHNEAPALVMNFVENLKGKELKLMENWNKNSHFDQ